MSFAPGAIVKTRGREWVVLPESETDLLRVRPLGGTDAESTGICLDLEEVAPAQFDLPNPKNLGDYRSCQLLRDAVRLGFRSSAGPFRSFGHLHVEPRPYQLAPLLMALKLDPVRLLIADDVGIGKTIEALLIAKELLDRGEIQRIAVLCPPHLAEQWQSEMALKFNIHAELVLPGTVRRLESNCALNQSLFDIYPFVIVSTDFIKSDRRRDDFVRACPEFVILDEAHTCAFSEESRGSRHQRHRLLQDLSRNPNRHLLLVTATPHSGNEGAFRSLLALINPEFADLPDDLSGEKNKIIRRRLAMNLVQRRRADIRQYLEQDTAFPTRLDKEESYKLSPAYADFFKKVVEYARETVKEGADSKFKQRIRWWSVLALLRAMASSPAAAAATLRNRASTADAQTLEEADKMGRNSVLDITDAEGSEGVDVTPGSDDTNDDVSPVRRRLKQMATIADSLRGDKDEKLLKTVKLVKEFLKEGFSPIIFCRFIDTADYLAQELRERLGGKIEIASVTGILPPDDRERRIEELGKADKRVLVCTDCLSEGINLQEHFDAVIHYDLSWNPTRHEQREGRVDRFGQPKKTVKVLTLYGIDNQIDGIVLDVLISKHRKIRSKLGISVPVPVESDKVIEAIFEGLLLRERAANAQDLLPGLDEFFKPQKESLHNEWENAADKEKKSQTMFAQNTIKPEEVMQELVAMQDAIGSTKDIEHFSVEALKANHATVSKNGSYKLDLREIPPALKEVLDVENQVKVKFDPASGGDATYLYRTHPFVENLATYVLDTALDNIAAENAVSRGQFVARRVGVIRTSQVSVVTTLLLLRLRYHIITAKEGGETNLLAEDTLSLAFEDIPQKASWLSAERTLGLYAFKPEGNVPADVASQRIEAILGGIPHLRSYLGKAAEEHGKKLLEAHLRVREASRMKVRCRIETCLPADILGIYHYLPKPKA